MVLLASVLAALTAFAGVYALVTPGRSRELTGRLERFDRKPGQSRDDLLLAPFSSRVGIPLLSRARSILGRLLPNSMVGGIERRLILSGEPVSAHAFFTIWLGAMAIGVLLPIALISGGVSGAGLVAVVALGVFVAAAPIYWLRLKVAARKRAMMKAFPDAVDLIVTTVEAGLSIDAALSEVGQQTRGPLGEELRLTVRETTLGRSRRDSLQRLVDRTDVAEIRSFVQALIQAEQTGIPIGQVLRTQAAQIRLKRRQRAEGDAQRAPVKLIIVLVLLVLPSMLMMVMGPAILRIQSQV